MRRLPSGAYALSPDDVKALKLTRWLTEEARRDPDGIRRRIDELPEPEGCDPDVYRKARELAHFVVDSALAKGAEVSE